MFDPTDSRHVSAVINKFSKTQSELDKAYETMKSLITFIDVNQIGRDPRPFPDTFNITSPQLSQAIEAMQAIAAAIQESLTPERIMALATIRSNIGIAVGGG